ncbi:MAG: DUF4279 domain-containing protein [Gammaproteobacteria bacterium]
MIPREMTSIMQLNPDFSLAKGEAKKHGSRPAAETVWSVKSISQSEDFETNLDEFTRFLYPYLPALKQLAPRCKIEFDCIVEIQHGEEVPPLGCTKQAIRFLAEVNGEFNIDLYCLD